MGTNSPEQVASGALYSSANRSQRKRYIKDMPFCRFIYYKRHLVHTGYEPVNKMVDATNGTTHTQQNGISELFRALGAVNHETIQKSNCCLRVTQERNGGSNELRTTT